MREAPESEPRPVSEGVWVLALTTPTLPPASATNTVVFAGDRMLVVEPATPHASEQARLNDFLARRRAEGRELAGLCITHHHADHIGYAARLSDRYGAPIFAHEQTAARVDFPVEAIDEDWQLELGDGQLVEALYTPGHAPGHLVLRERKSGLAHVGDLVAGEGTILIDVRDDGDMGLYLDSLRRMIGEVRRDREAGHRPRFVPAHGPVLDDPLAILEHYIAHRLAREARVRTAVLEQGHRSFPAILASAYADKPKQIWPLAALALEAHLRKLVADGELIRRGLGARPA